jgi:hypothetical protein
MTHQASALPAAWERAPRDHNRDLGLLIRGMSDHREEILKSYPLLKLPSDHPRVFTPVAALLLAWERWDHVQGKCPECGARALGISFGGLLNIGSVGGVCTKCTLVVTRPIAGIAAAIRGSAASVKGTPYEFKFVNFRFGFRGIPRSLVGVLRKLGVKQLPKASREADEPISGGAYYTMDGARIA